MGDALCSLIHSFTRSLVQKGQSACKGSLGKNAGKQPVEWKGSTCTGQPTRWGCLGLPPRTPPRHTPPSPAS